MDDIVMMVVSILGPAFAGVAGGALTGVAREKSLRARADFRAQAGLMVPCDPRRAQLLSDAVEAEAWLGAKSAVPGRARVLWWVFVPVAWGWPAVMWVAFPAEGPVSDVGFWVFCAVLGAMLAIISWAVRDVDRRRSQFVQDYLDGPVHLAGTDRLAFRLNSQWRTSRVAMASSGIVAMSSVLSAAGIGMGWEVWRGGAQAPSPELTVLMIVTFFMTAMILIVYLHLTSREDVAVAMPLEDVARRVRAEAARCDCPLHEPNAARRSGLWPWQRARAGARRGP
ncbi:hypothetical protein ACQBAT_06495 [Ornithinimicrobium sp. Y1847]|uniref:hypothetical protein n=1 Tax=Ornithinimicrobium sp. Y1847 TaxID=3405419 RepID=UPI003B678B66